MELRKCWDFRKIFVVAYCVLFVVYLAMGLRPVAEAADYEVTAELAIPSIGLESDVTTLKLADHRLETPDVIVGSFSSHKNKTLLIGHSSTVFRELDEVEVGDVVVYDETRYRVVATEIWARGDINMDEVLAETEQETIAIMTCAGEDLGGGDATHRLIITAVSE